jgi:Do/DeqQ family serine protease
MRRIIEWGAVSRSRIMAGAAGLALLLAAGLVGASLAGPPAQAGTFEAVHEAPAISPVAAATGYADLVARVAPAIVTVRSERLVKPAGVPFGDEQLVPFLRNFGFGVNPRELQPHREGGLGSGVIVSGDGTILTNNHVVQGATKVRVELADRRSLEAKVVGTDTPSDLAVLKVDAGGLPALPFGDSDRIRVGDVVLAFGNPLGVGQTVTMGIVSAKGRATSVGDGSFEDFLQTDAAINQGNSGGALVSTAGQLVGINSQILSPSGGNIGIGFAIPARMAQNVMAQLVNGGEVRRGLLGVTVQGVTSDLATSLGLPEVSGALVSSVTKGSPADRAGVERGDVIVSLDGQGVSDGNQLRNRVASTRPGSSVSLGLVRDGRQKTVSVQLGELHAAQAKAESGGPGEGGRLGLAVRPLSPDEAAELHLDLKQGLVVSDVDPTGPAADAGIRPGDVIEQVNHRPVGDVAALKAAVRASGGKPALFLLARDGQSLYLAVESPKA